MRFVIRKALCVMHVSDRHRASPRIARVRGCRRGLCENGAEKL